MPATQELLNQGRYRIEQQFGADGDSTAFSAYDTVGNVNVVVKEIPLKMSKVTTLSQQENSKIAFTNQAQSLKDLRHESILSVEDYFFDVGRQYLVLESVEGENLQNFLQGSRGPTDFAKVANWSDQLLNALEFLGSRAANFVHGKINPGHIYVNVDGRVKLVSIGVSENGDVSFDTALEQAGSETANLCYSPLEQIWDGLDPASQKVISNSYDETSGATLLTPPDGRSDVYSLGAVIYHLITGNKPVDALERSIEILEGNPDPLMEPSKVNPEISAEFSSFVLKALEVRREKRHDGPAVMHQALKTTLKLIEERANSESRVEAESREEEEAANDLKVAVTARQEEVQRLIEAQKQEFEAEKIRHEKLLQEKLRAAEERAAAAEKLLRDQEAARAVSEAKHAVPVSAEDDLLHITSTPNPTLQTISAKSELDLEVDLKTANVSAEVVQEPVPEDAASAERHHEPVSVEPEVENEGETVENKPVAEAEKVAEAIDRKPTVTATPFSAYEPFEYQADEKEKPLPLAMIAGGVVAVIVLIGGLWAAGIFGSDTPTPSPQQAVTVPVEVPAQPEAIAPDPQPETPQQALADDPQGQDTSEQSTEPVDKPVAAATPRPRKPVAEPTKPKAEPKKVTVDDLINDN